MKNLKILLFCEGLAHICKGKISQQFLDILSNCVEFGIKPEILDSLMKDLEIIRPPGKKIVSDYSKTIKRVNIIYLNDKMYCGSYLGLKQSISWLK